MFDNIGEKIKGFAKVVCWIGIIASVVFGFSIMSNGHRLYSLLGILAAGLGSLLSWVGSFITYGFGQLVANSDIIANQYRNESKEDIKEESEPVKNEYDYGCESIEVSGIETIGFCRICGTKTELTNCTIKNEVGKRDLNICKNCISKYKASVKEK